MTQLRPPDAWEHAVDEAFATVLEAEPHRRDTLLATFEASNPALARELRSLLRLEANSRQGFEDELASLPKNVLEDLSEELAPEEFGSGDRIGPYRVSEVIGRGGWGTLYLAEHTTEPAGPVALKLLRRGLDTADVLRRFESERRILASLEHPNIARFLDAGSTPDGRPYLVLTYVDGRPITQFCRDRRSPTDERLRLFLDLCDAVQYAHRRLIVHRDLKPGNVLVDRGGRARLLDFGIAKLLSGDETGALTRTGIRLFTPEYAAPEQIRGEPATTATDVYQLSHLLYRLLTGRSPYGEPGGTVAEMQRIVCGVEPPPPSRVVQRGSADPELPPAVPSRRLQGDLDTILLKGLRKDPEERYASVEALADDVRAYLDGRPVRARPESRVYRFSRMIRRNPWPSTAVLVALLGLSGWGLTVHRYASELALERDRAQAQTRTAEEVTSFLTDLFALPGEPMGDTTTVGTLLERGVERADTQLPGDPPLQAGILSVMGQSYLSLGQAGEALPLMQRALEIEGGFDADPAGRIRALNRLGSAQRSTGDVEGARSAHTEALELAREHFGDRSLEYSSALNYLGLTEQAARNGAESEALYRETIELRQWLRETDPSTHDAALPALPLHNLGNLLNALGRPDEAIPYLEEAVERLEPFPEYDRNRGTTLNVLGMTRQRLGDRDGAEEALRASVELRRSTLGPRHPDLAVSLQNYSVLLRAMERYDEAEDRVLESLAIRDAIYGPNHPQTELSLNSLGNLYRDTGRTDEAVEVLEDLLERRIERLGEGSISVVASQNNLARALQDRGQFREAEDLMQAAIATLEGTGQAGTPAHLTIRNNLGRLYLEWGDSDRARVILEETLAGREERLGPDHPDTELTRELLSLTTEPRTREP